MKIVGDREVCVGAGMCVLTSEDLFDQDAQEGRVVVLRQPDDDETRDLARKAVELCPSGALWIEDDDDSAGQGS